MRTKRPHHHRRAYTLVEVLASVLIISIISSFALVDVGSADASTRLDRAAQQILAAFRYARTQSLGHGQTTGTAFQPNDAYGVQISTDTNTLTVYHSTWNSGTSKWNLPGTAVATSLYGSGTYIINLASDPAFAGVKITAVSLTGTSDTTTNTSSPYYCQYRPFGTTLNPGKTAAAITLSYGGKTCSINIPAVGDPQEN